MAKRVAIVTGANRGIGLSVVKKLCQVFDGDVFLTARNTEKGLLALQKLRQEGYSPIFYPLDIAVMRSIQEFRKFIIEEYGAIDILVNNAGESYSDDCTIPYTFQASTYIQTNFRGTLNMCKMFLSLFRPHSRIVIMSSESGLRKYLGAELQRRLDVETMTLNQLVSLAEEYRDAVRRNVQQKKGWPEKPHQVSKILQVAMAKILARDLQNDMRKNIVVNACCPGLGIQPDTDVAAEDIVWLTLLPPGTEEPNGELVQFRKTISFCE